MSGAIETAQLQPLDDNAAQRRRAMITCAARILEERPDTHPEHPGPEVRHELLELLRAFGLAHDPHALVRIPTDPKRTMRARPQET